MFAISGTSGKLYYPAFFADDRYSKEALCKISQALGVLPEPSKYYFLTNKSTFLGQTPLEAVAMGRLANVLMAAEAFRER
jgi:hypothetical protein